MTRWCCEAVTATKHFTAPGAANTYPTRGAGLIHAPSLTAHPPNTPHRDLL